MEILHANNNIRESGAKKSDFKIFTDLNPVDKKGNPLPFAVAMVAKCVAHYRRCLRPLKTIYLCPSHFNKFDLWARQHMTEQEADSRIALYTFDGCEIEMMKEGHIVRGGGSDEFDWDFYVPKRND